MKGLNIVFIPREKQKSKYDWADIKFDNQRVGKARCMINGNEFTIYSITIYPEYQGNGYGRKFIETIIPQYKRIIADRVRFSAIGFWKKVGFILDEETGVWTYNKNHVNYPE